MFAGGLPAWPSPASFATFMLPWLAGRHDRWLKALVVSAMLTFVSQEAQGQSACPYGRDPVSLRCLPRPTNAPLPPPTLEITAVPAAEVYRLVDPAPPPGGLACDPNQAGARRVGKTPLTLEGNKELKRGKELFCLVTPDYAPSLLSVDIPATGVTRRSVELVPLAGVQLRWDDHCAYRLPPEAVDVAIDGNGPFRSSVPVRLRMKPGTHRLVISADEFAPISLSLEGGAPGSIDVIHPVCLTPNSSISVRNRPTEHTLEGLFLRVQDTEGRLLWQGDAPQGKGQTTIAVRRSDRAVFSLFADARYLTPIPSEAAVFSQVGGATRGEKVRDSGGTFEGYVRLPVADVPPNIDREELARRCRTPGGAACVNEAYLRWRDGKKPDDSLERLCSTPAARPTIDGAGYAISDGEIRECVVRPLDAGENDRRLGLTKVCQTSQGREAWLACLRVSQPSLPPADFLVFDGDVPRAEKVAELTGDVGIDFMTATVVRPRGAGIAWLGVALHVKFLRHLGVRLGLYPYSVSLFPAETSDGGSAGSKWYGGGGLSLGYSWNPHERVRVDLGAFVLGYYTASGSSAAPYAGLDFLLVRTETLNHHVGLRGGYGHFPNVLLVGADARESVGASWRPFVGATYTAAIPIKE